MNHINNSNFKKNRFKITIWLIGLYIITIPFQKILHNSYLQYKIQPSEIIFLLIFFSFLVRLDFQFIKYQWHKRKINLIDFSVIIWLIIELINLFFNQNRTTIFEFFGQVYLISLYGIIRIVVPKLGDKNDVFSFLKKSFRIMALIIFGTIFLGVISVVIFDKDLGVFWRFKDYPYFGTIYRLKAFTNEPVMLASILSPVIIMEFFSFKKREVINSSDFFLRNSIYYLVLFSAMLLFTFSKSITCLAATILLLVARYHPIGLASRWFFKSLAISFLLLYVVMSHLIITKNSSREGQGYGMESPFIQFNGIYAYKTWYLVQKENAIALFRDHPIIGVGGGNMVNILEQNSTKPTYYYSTYDPLSSWVGILAEYGLIGFIGVAGLFYSLITYLTNISHENYIKYTFLGIFLYFILEAICTDIMNFRHLWVSLGFYSSIYSISNVKS